MLRQAQHEGVNIISKSDLILSLSMDEVKLGRSYRIFAFLNVDQSRMTTFL